MYMSLTLLYDVAKLINNGHCHHTRITERCTHFTDCRPARVSVAPWRATTYSCCHCLWPVVVGNRCWHCHCRLGFLPHCFSFRHSCHELKRFCQMMYVPGATDKTGDRYVYDTQMAKIVFFCPRPWPPPMRSP